MNKAYYVGIGKPDEYKPYGLDQPEQVAMDMAGIYAADTAANILSLSFRDDSVERGYIRALKLLADTEWSVFSYKDKLVMMNIANVAWRAGQPFRGLAGFEPLSKISRPANQQFNLLSAEEQMKDEVQIRAGATYLLYFIRNEERIAA